MAKPGVFISCVSGEFATVRQTVANCLIRLGYEPVFREIFGTESGDLRQVLREKIDGCEGLIQIVGHGYGAEPPTVDANYGRVSYTQFEFLYARERGKKTWLIFAGTGVTRDRAVEELDLPMDGDSSEPKSHQEERRDLQRGYHDVRKGDGHLYHHVGTITELELAIERLREELALLRRQETDFRASVSDDLGEIKSVLHQMFRSTSLRSELSSFSTSSTTETYAQSLESPLKLARLSVSPNGLHSLTPDKCDEVIAQIQARTNATQVENERDLLLLLNCASNCIDERQLEFANDLLVRILKIAPSWHEAQFLRFRIEIIRGDTAMRESTVTAAQEFYLGALEIAENLPRTGAANHPWSTALAHSLDKLGEVTMAQGSLARAKEYFAHAANLRTERERTSQ